LLSLLAITAAAAPGWSLTSVQVGASGKTYASAEVQCALNLITGMAPMVQAGLYNPKKNASATVSLNGDPVAAVTFLSPDTTLWLANGVNTVVAAVSKKTADTYAFDASLTYPDQPNACIPDAGGNTIDASNDLEIAASGDSSATLTPGCARNPLSGQPQLYVNLFDDGGYLLDVSINNVPLTQLNGTTRTHIPVFLVAGLNVISAANGSVSTDYYVRDGGDGSCTLP
jgi:hypothetical protein